MDNLIPFIIIFFLILLSITMFILAFAKPKQQEDINLRLKKLSTTPTTEKSVQKTGYQKLNNEFNQITKRVAPLAEKIINPNLEENYRIKLIKAGKYQTDVTNFIST